MDISQVFAKLKELGHVHSKLDELREYCDEKLPEILKCLSHRILCSDGGDILDCILNGLSDKTPNNNNVKIIDIVLQSMRKQSASLTHCGDVISRLCLELPRLSVDNLVRWCNDSVQTIIDDSDINMIWRDVLPECMSALSSYETVKHCDTEMLSREYKEQCVHTLCQCHWREGQYVQLAAMFKDMHLSRNDHKQVVNKICSYMIDIAPDSLPPLVHQLLKLCKSYHLDIVLSHLSHYFKVRLYSKLEPPPQDSESTTVDMDDIVGHSPAELSRCLSTCIYHVAQGAVDPQSVRRHLKSWPKTQILRAPFIMDLALAMSDKGADFRSVCLDVIKCAIEQRELDELRSKECAWVRSVMPPDVDVASVLKVLTTESANHRQLTVLGLINLAFCLLGVARTRPVAQACWSHGKLVLVRLSKSQPETAPHILSELADKLAGHGAQRQYADCLHVLCKLTPVSVERCTQLSTILENCQPSSTEYLAGAAVLDAVHPLINFSTRTRDTLVMVCRKGLYSRDSYHRRLAVSGFLTVLGHIKLSRGVFSSSQSVCSDQYSAHSYLTQLTVDLHATQQGAVVTSRVRNEAICMEVVSILRRCLVQDAMVKELLYTKIYECAKDKPALHESILELLHEHLSKYIPEAHEATPLLVDKCVQTTTTTATLVEPISRLLYVIAQFLQAGEEEDVEDILGSESADTGSAHLKNMLNKIMQDMCNNENFGRIDLEDPGLGDLTPETKAKSLQVQQLVQCYEALMAYRIMQWNSTSSDAANSVYKLFKDCDQLLDKTKAPPKIAKKRRKSMNETRDTANTQKSQKSPKDTGKSPNKLSNLVKDRAGPFKPLPCLWDPKLCLRVVDLLYSEEVPWCSLEQRNQLRGRRDFHQWALRGTLSVLTAEGLEKRAVANHVVHIARVLYGRCIRRFEVVCAFDGQAALLCVEIFRTCLNLLFSPTYCLKMNFFLPTITGLSETPPPACIAAVLEDIHTALMQMEAEDLLEERDVSAKKLMAALQQVAATLLDTRVLCSDEMNTVIAKFEIYLRTSKQDCLSLTPSVLTAGCRKEQDAQFLDDLLMKLTTALGRIDEDDTSSAEDSTNFPSVDSRTGHIVLSHVCAHLTDRFKYVEHLVSRARDLTVALNTAASNNQQRIDKELKELYKCIVMQLCQLTTWCSGVASLRCSVGGGGGGGGGGSERVLGTCVRLYALLAALAKQLDVATAQHVRFERLLKLSGKKLSSVTDNLITYLEASQHQQKASKVLRDTKLIPRLVLEAEQYSKHVILLANKGKVNWQQYLSLGTARDFRIKAPVLEEVLNARDRHVDPDDTRDEENQGDVETAETEIISPLVSDGEQDGGDGEERSRRKKRRAS